MFLQLQRVTASLANKGLSQLQSRHFLHTNLPLRSFKPNTSSSSSAFQKPNTSTCMLCGDPAYLQFESRRYYRSSSTNSPSTTPLSFSYERNKQIVASKHHQHTSLRLQVENKHYFSSLTKKWRNTTVGIPAVNYEGIAHGWRTASKLSLPMLDYRRSYVSKKNYTFPELKDSDLEEEFVRGSGPGGQAVNQTANCVVLKHKPSGIVVKCHETRSLPINRQRARERLQERLDQHLHGDKSFLALQAQQESRQRQETKTRNRKRLEMKKAFKERENLD